MKGVERARRELRPEKHINSIHHIRNLCWWVSWGSSVNAGQWSSLASLRCGCSICLADWRGSWGNSIHTASPRGDESSPFALDDCPPYANLGNYVPFAGWLWTHCSANAGYCRRAQCGKIGFLGEYWAKHVIHMYSMQTGSTQLLLVSGPPRMCHTVSFRLQTQRRSNSLERIYFCDYYCSEL